MHRSKSLTTGKRAIALAALMFLLLAAAQVMQLLYAPTEATMGHVQRILYLHVSVAWCGLLSGLIMGICGLLYLVRRRLTYDHWAQAAGEVSWLCVTLTLATGSLWAHEAWGVWWTWEPRLMTLLLLWMVYAGIFLTRGGIDEPHERARTGAVLSILAVADIPLIYMATRWFRGVHPVAPTMDGRMHVTMMVSVLSFSAFFAWCIIQRRKQIATVNQMTELAKRLENE